MLPRASRILATAVASALAAAAFASGPPPSMDWQLKKKEGDRIAQGFVQAVDHLQPRAFFLLDAPRGESRVGHAGWEATGSVAIAADGAIRGSRHALFDGRDGAIRTTQVGGQRTGATLLAWVRLDALPSSRKRAFFVIGEPQAGNDFDLRFDADDTLRLRTGAAAPLAWKPPAEGLLHGWHLLAATLDTHSGERAIYWDGASVASDTAGGRPGRTAPLAIGGSDAVPGSSFEGGIEDAALWDEDIGAATIKDLYRSSQPPRAADR